jgi:hypothetical protein
VGEVWLAIALLAGTAILAGAAVRGAGAWRRRRGVARIPHADRERSARGVRAGVQVGAGSLFPGMSATRRNVTTLDLVLGRARLIVASERGVLLDLTAGRSRPLDSVRCTGPGRLVLEGGAPRIDGTRTGWRMEIAIDDAEGWAAALAPFAGS